MVVAGEHDRLADATVQAKQAKDGSPGLDVDADGADTRRCYSRSSSQA